MINKDNIPDYVKENFLIVQGYLRNPKKVRDDVPAVYHFISPEKVVDIYECPDGSSGAVIDCGSFRVWTKEHILRILPDFIDRKKGLSL
jgi:hypothetical protein